MMQRRHFVKNAAALATGSVLSAAMPAFAFPPIAKKRLALVGTGSRGTGFWGVSVLRNFSQQVEFVALCDTNPGRLAYAKKKMQLNCPTYGSIAEMLRSQKPDMVIVTTRDSDHDDIIVAALEAGCDVITEKPMTTDEVKCKRILEAEKRTGRNVIVGFNYRHSPHMTKLKELLSAHRVGDLVSVDFNWYLNTYHGADYFRRWHAYTRYGGSLWVHKATHHFDLVNWWINSEPVEVSAYGKLNNYGKNGKLRGTNCRSCAHTSTCKFYYDITQNKEYMNLYVANEHHDGYLRDACVFREDIDIYDTMSAQVMYANGVTLNYSLTAFSPYEGWRIAFNGMNGRIDSWQDIPYQQGNLETVDQASRHALEMTQGQQKPTGYEEIIVSDNFKKGFESVKVPKYAGGHGGGDLNLHQHIFGDPSTPDPLGHMAGTRDGAMSILIGIAARKSIEQKRPVRIAELTDLVPRAVRMNDKR